MMNNRLSSLLIPVVVLLTLATANAQTTSQTNTPADAVIRGRLVDASDAPVAGAAVVLFNRDSVYLDAVASGTDGRFEIRSSVRPYRLQIQHLAYELRTIEADRAELGDIRLTETNTTVDAVVVKGERPVVKVEQGRLNYDLGQLTEGQAVNNAYEALTRLPGVAEQDGTLTLAGTSSVTVILNGRPSTMTAEQLATLLRSTPVERVEKAEVMFSAPPQYHVRGAAINVVLRRSHETAFSGELHANYTNRYYDTYDAGGNFVLTSPKWSADVIYSAARSKELSSFDLHSLHTFEGQPYDIRQDEWMTSEGWSHQLRAAVEYAPKQRGRLSAAYTASFSPNTDGISHSTGTYVESLSKKLSDRTLHNLALRYTSAFGLDLGLDYTHYDNPEQSRLENSYADGSATAFDVGSGQRIDRLNATVDERHAFDSGWELTAGGAFAFARSHDWQHYTILEGDPATSDTDARLDEYTANLYAGFGRQFGRVGFTASLAGEYYRLGDYENWSLYPQASLNWMPSEQHIVQLNFSSDKEYPAYWEMQGAISYIDGYSEIHGTSGLRPSRSYEAQAVYIYRQKYIFVLFWNERPDYFVQAAWQSSDRLALIYQSLNWNFNRQWGVNAVIPFRIGKWLNSRLTLTGMRMRQKCDPFHDMSFDRSKWVGIARLVNTFHLSRKPAIDLEVNGFFQSGAIQGTFDIEPLGSADAAVKWTFDQGRATLSVRCNDLFDSGMPKTEVRYRGQWLDMGAQRYTRTATVHFSYRFGGYKAKKHREVDTSRFGH
ncbi:MAG TPA: TonB-dependent receptor family protein [Candidatus Alistipes intestinipullorum]|nr:TonB-dependent receptor family protein [Candidatus Alistipes intestinipullorum]